MHTDNGPDDPDELEDEPEDDFDIDPEYEEKKCLLKDIMAKNPDLSFTSSELRDFFYDY